MSARPASHKFERRREDILDAAAAQINLAGVRGMTLADVARQVGLNTTSITYYFRRKDQLAFATFERTLGELEAQVEAAGSAGNSAPARVDALIDSSFARLLAQREGRERPLVVLSDIRALDAPLRRELGARYAAILDRVAEFFAPADPGQRWNAAMRAHVLLENLFWLPAWIGRYAADDFARVAARFREIFAAGIAARPADWHQPPLLLVAAEGDAGFADEFTRAATILINQRGYRGASVDAIAGELNVTKGSFYHHLTGKDDLVVACFERSFDRVSAVQSAAMASGANHAQQLGSAVATLLDIQLHQPFPLLRTTALQAVPAALRGEVIERSNRMARRFAGLMIDGITDGSIRAVDPLIASQIFMAALNSAFELRRWAGEMPAERAVTAYAAILGGGFYETLGETR